MLKIIKLYENILFNLIISSLIVTPIFSKKIDEKSIEEILKEFDEISLTTKVMVDRNNELLFTFLHDFVKEDIGSEKYMTLHSQTLDTIASNELIVDYINKDKNKIKILCKQFLCEQLKKIESENNCKPLKEDKSDDVDILALKDEITRRQFLALLSIIKETTSSEIYQQQKESFLKIIQEHEKLSSLLKEELEMNKINHEQHGFEPDAHCFIPKIPKALTPEERNINILERIKKKYIGDIPHHVQDVIFYFSNYEKCIKNDLSIHNRLLLHGKPGTGKSYLVQVLAEQLELPFLFFTGSFFGDKYIGESSRRIRKAFQVAKKYGKPILLFIDEIDALATKRKETTHTEHRAALLTLLSEMQDVQDNKNIFIFAATNNFKILDKAIKDRFSGAVCEIKELSLQSKAQLITKVFLDKGKVINPDFAQRLAEMITPSFFAKNKNHFSNRDIIYIVTTSLLKHFADYSKNPATTRPFCSYVHTTINGMTKKGRFAWFKPLYSNGI